MFSKGSSFRVWASQGCLVKSQVNKKNAVQTLEYIERVENNEIKRKMPVTIKAFSAFSLIPQNVFKSLLHVFVFTVP